MVPETIDPPITTGDHLRDVVDSVSFGPSLDWGWRWSAITVVGGWILSCTFDRRDRDTGEMGRGTSRPWFIHRGSTESAVFKTMFAAAKMIVEHELMESFLVLGRRPFDPHCTIHELIR